MNTYDTLFDWIDNTESSFADEQLEQSLHDIIVLEHDCERKVLHLISHNPIEGFDSDKYIRAANCYLFHYHINRELRKRPLSPIYNDEVLKDMPNVFSKDVSYYLDKNNISALMRQAFLIKYE
jgi:hypothetical protein